MAVSVSSADLPRYSRPLSSSLRSCRAIVGAITARDMHIDGSVDGVRQINPWTGSYS
jgi:hypothetical protein